MGTSSPSIRAGIGGGARLGRIAVSLLESLVPTEARRCRTASFFCESCRKRGGPLTAPPLFLQKAPEGGGGAAPRHQQADGTRAGQQPKHTSSESTRPLF